jgi:hypothetical protein
VQEVATSGYEGSLAKNMNMNNQYMIPHSPELLATD